MFDTEYIENALESLNLAGRKNRDHLISIREEQRENEEILFQNMNACPGPENLRLRLQDNLPNINNDELKKISSDELYNEEAINSTACVINSVVYTSNITNKSLSSSERARRYFNNLHQIGEPSVEGYAMIGDLGDNMDPERLGKQLFVLKAPRKPENDNLTHEVIVGVYGVNQLRSSVLNFSTVYGGLRCSPPVIDEDSKKVLTFCSSEKDLVTYALYENIAPADTAKKFLETCSVQEFLNMYLQIVYALRLAKDVCDFTHYDLHSSNVLIRKLDKEYELVYETEKGVEYIRSNFVASIIDYGYSHIKYDENHYGKFGLYRVSTFMTTSWIFHDLYKFLCFCMRSTIQKNRAVFETIGKIIKFFNTTDSAADILKYQWENRYAFPLTAETSKLDVNSYTAYIRKHNSCKFIRSNPVLEVLACGEYCETSKAIYNKIGVSPTGRIEPPNRITDLYDIVIKLQHEGRNQDKKEILEKYNYDANIRRFIRLIEQNVEKMTLIKPNFNARGEKLKQLYNDVTKLYDLNITTLLDIQIGEKVAKYFNDASSLRKLENLRKRVAGVNVNGKIDRLKEIDEEIDDEVGENDEEEEFKDKLSEWLNVGRKSYQVIFKKK